MKKVFKKIFIDSEKRAHILWRYFAFGVGCLIFQIGLLLIADMLLYSYMNKKETDIVTITKPISLSTSLGFSNTIFNEKELDELREVVDNKSLGLFYGNRFRAKANTSGMLGFSTELFLETINKEFLEKDFKNWKWSKGSKYVPIIIGQEFLSMYNFGFALSQGLPQLSAGAISELEFDLQIKGKGRQSSFRASIVGVSSQINSILVPKEFMFWANENFGQNKADELNKIMLKLKDEKRKQVLSYIKSKGWDINGLDRNNAFDLLYVLIGLMFIVGLAILSICYINFLSHGKLIVLKVKNDIFNLFCIGVSPQAILAYWQSGFLKRMLFSLTLISTAYFILSYYIHKYISLFSVDVSYYSIASAYVLSLFIFFYLYKRMRNNLSNEISLIYPG